MAEIASRTIASDPDPTVVLIQDGVFLDPADLLAGDRVDDVETYAVRKDVAVRGVDLPATVEPIAYDRLGGLLFEQEVRSFV
jgi:sulfur transfer complex TusBCD TusB component (DsrH family)